MANQASLVSIITMLAPVLSLLLVAATAAGIMVYPSKHSAIQANAATILVGTLIVLFLKSSIVYMQAPYIVILGLIALVMALIILNIAIMVKGKK